MVMHAAAAQVIERGLEADRLQNRPYRGRDLADQITNRIKRVSLGPAQWQGEGGGEQAGQEGFQIRGSMSPNGFLRLG